MTRRVGVVVAVAVVLTAIPGTAEAATVSSTPGDGKYYSPKLTFQAHEGETNDVTLSGTDRDRRVVDSAARLTAGTGCRQVGEHEAVCGNAYDTLIMLSDGNDRVALGDDLVHGEAYVAGEAGDDVLVGGAAGETLEGGDGRDTIEGRGGDDSIAGDDTTPFADRLDGGAGLDSLEYEKHPLGVRVDLSDPAAPAGGAGEGDMQSGFEQALAGAAGPNVLIGNGADNFLMSEARGSRVVGGAGRDVLMVKGDSVAEGGAGDDYLTGPPGSSIACGAGTDVVRGGNRGLRRDWWYTNGFGLVTADCERMPIEFPEVRELAIRPHPSLRGERASFRIPCPRDFNTRSGCSGRVLLRDTRGRALGKRLYSTRPGRTPTVGVTLSKGTLRRIGRPGGLEVRVSLLVDRGRSERADATYSVVLSR